MDPVGANLLEEIIASFEETYHQYLAYEELADAPAVKLGFYRTVELMVKKKPMPVELMQRAVLARLREVQEDLVNDDLMDQIEAMSMNVSEERANKLENVAVIVRDDAPVVEVKVPEEAWRWLSG